MEQPIMEQFGIVTTTPSNFDRLACIAHWIEENVHNKADEHQHQTMTMSAPKSTRKNSRLSDKRDKVSTNRLGGHYSTGRPLPMEIREKIVELSKSGLKPCQISKELRVSHGCVSKLLAKWRKTGTVKPEKIGGSRPKKVLPSVARAITVYKHYKPRLQSWQIKEFLIKDGVCNDGNVPSISSINKTLRNQKKAKSSDIQAVFTKNTIKDNRCDEDNISTSDTSRDDVTIIAVHPQNSNKDQHAQCMPPHHVTSSEAWAMMDTEYNGNACPHLPVEPFNLAHQHQQYYCSTNTQNGPATYCYPHQHHQQVLKVYGSDRYMSANPAVENLIFDFDGSSIGYHHQDSVQHQQQHQSISINSNSSVAQHTQQGFVHQINTSTNVYETPSSLDMNNLPTFLDDVFA